MNTERGFTLLEVLVALAVFATLAGAAASAVQFVTRQTVHLQERLLASWVLDNHWALMQLEGATASNRTLGTRMGGRDWLIEQHLDTPGADGLRRVKLTVRLAASGIAVQHLDISLAASHE